MTLMIMMVPSNSSKNAMFSRYHPYIICKLRRKKNHLQEGIGSLHEIKKTILSHVFLVYFQVAKEHLFCLVVQVNTTYSTM